MAGSFKILINAFLLFFFLGCNNLNEQKEIGINLIDNNVDLFISNLYGIQSRNAPIFILNRVGEHDFITLHCESIVEMNGLNLVENCKSDFYELINKEGFHINKNTKYTNFDLNKMSYSPNIKVITAETNIKQKEYIKIEFSNFFIDKNKAFVIVQESDYQKIRIEGKVDIYFFEKKDFEWVYLKKVMLITG